MSLKQPKFKVGDVIKEYNVDFVWYYIILDIIDGYYYYDIYHVKTGCYIRDNYNIEEVDKYMEILSQNELNIRKAQLL